MNMKKKFYPTPKELLDRIFQDAKWWNVKSVLEPSAGMGDIADYMKSVAGSHHDSLNIDCIEIDAEFREVVNYPDTSNRASCFLHRSIDHPNGCNVLRNVHRRRLGLFHPYIFMI